MQVHFLTQDQDYPGEHSEVLEVLLQLRGQYTLETLAAQVKKQLAQGYQLVYVQADSGILAVAGFVVTEKLAWGKCIYIDDLVTNSACRSQGVGHFLISWFKNYAKAHQCTQIHLDSGVQRFPAHRFYLREGFNIASHHFSMLDV
ncbi:MULTISPECIES: GNAT family N-acetyltransferase [unclassified Pseudoalteromonas]|uniref:GNAT family N-acetyltransferase n=1 Tax=unclassified Pseudoalteromonas TaxID=194690 RepID=UPI000CF62857|nr:MULTISPECIES: GNAT family N-acetyltransferase [unclassified Pseudoalteromonas]